MKRPRPFLAVFLWSAVVAVLLALIMAGILTNITLRSVEKNLPNTLFEQLHDLELIVDNLAEVVSAAELAKALPSSENFKRLRQKVNAVRTAVVGLRNTYVFDNLIQASAFHAVVAPAIADAELWLSEGISGYGPETHTTIGIVLSRVSEAFQKSRDQNHASEISAQKILNEQRNRLDQFLFSVNLLFTLALVTTLIMLFLLTRQNMLERREVEAQAERRRAEEALQVQEERLRLAMEASQQGWFDLNVQTGEVSVSPEYARIIGYEPSEFETNLQGWIEGLLPEDRDAVLRAFRECVETGGPRTMEYRRQTKTGEWKWIRSMGKIVGFDSEKKPLRMAGTHADISEYKRTQEALRESQERFRELAELLPETIFEMDCDGNLTFVNQNAFDHFGFSREDFEHGLNAFQMVSPEDRLRALENSRRVMSGEKLGLNEYKALRKDGSSFPAIMHSAAKLHDGKPVGLRGIVIDITETKKLEAQLRQAHKIEAIGTLAGGIAHDFNNILAALIGYTEMALTDVSMSTPTRHYLGQVLKASHRAKDLVKQILASSRQRHAQERTPLTIAPIVKETIKLLRASLPTTIEIRLNIESETGVVLADPTEVHQVLVNLCTNAAHAMEERGGLLEISLDEVTVDPDAVAAHGDLKPGQYLRLTVSDTGRGIDPTILERIFDPYFTTKEVGKGSGLGLAVVHGIVKRHEGAIMVNTEPGVGTSFHVYLPKVESATSKEVEEVEKPLPQGAERILFVDDEEILAEMGKSVLEWLGYEVTVTTSSVEALELFRTQPDRFDAVITDYTMPHTTGADLAKEMMRIRPGIPVIMCTGFSERISEAKASDMGIRAFAMKPLNMRNLAETVRRVLDKK
jgi:PAS domain S-box-containing protein